MLVTPYAIGVLKVSVASLTLATNTTYTASTNLDTIAETVLYEYYATNATNINGVHTYVDAFGVGHQVYAFIAESNQPAAYFKDWVGGSYAEHVWDTTYALTNGHEVAGMVMFSTMTLATTNFAWNTNCWLYADYGDDLSGLAIANGTTTLSYFGGAAAISSRVITTCEHWPETIVGRQYLFIGVDNVPVVRTCIAANVEYYGDLRFGLLDSDLPATVHPFAIMDDTMQTRIPSYDDINDVLKRPPTICVNQLQEAFLIRGDSTPWNKIGVDGDSGHAWMLPVAGHLALMGHFYSSTSPRNYSDSLDWYSFTNMVHSLLVTNGVDPDVYSPAYVSLSEWPSYE